MEVNLKRLITPELLRWLVVGVAFTVIGTGLIGLFAGVLAWPFWIATLTSGEVGTLLRFLVVDRWVFGHRRPTGRRLWHYHIANAAGFGVWWGAANALKAGGVHYLLAPVLAIGFSVGLGILSNFFWIWRKPARPPVESERHASGPM